MRVNHESWLFKGSLLSISTLLMSAPVISAALPLMFEDFPHYSKSSIETLLTVPNFGIILGLLCSPFCIRLFNKKRTVILGLVITLICGLIPLISNQYAVLFIVRFGYGIGVGLFNSLAVSLLALFYEGDELATMMGYQSMAGSLGSAVFSFIISYLVIFGWHQIFLVYLLIIPIIFLFIFFVPLKTDYSKDIQEDQTDERVAFNIPVLAISGFIFLLFAFFMTAVVKLPEFIISTGLGDSSKASIIAGINTLVGIPIGILYGKIYQVMRQLVLPVGLLLVSIGFLIIGSAHSLLILVIGILFIGTGFGISIPFIYTWTAQLAPKGAVNISYTCLIVATNIGVFCSPLILNFFGQVFDDSSARFSMFVASSGMLVLFVFMSFILSFLIRKNN